MAETAGLSAARLAEIAARVSAVTEHRRGETGQRVQSLTQQLDLVSRLLDRDVPDLLAEVRRLRAVVGRLTDARDDDEFPPFRWNGRASWQECSWCHEVRGNGDGDDPAFRHAADCPWWTARRLLVP